MNNENEAHFIALKTLRKRCEYLEKRLEFVEQENCQLKLEKVKIKDTAMQNSCDISSLEKQVILLNNENSKMSHQIEMITAENQTLWLQLNSLMTGNSSLEKTLATSNCHKFEDTKKSCKPNKFSWFESSSAMDDCNKESLEEISLKLINGMVMGKTELENQYSQMIDLQKETNPVEIKRFSFMPSQFDTRGTLGSLKVYIQKLKDFKECLHQQKIDLGNVILHIKSLPQNSEEHSQNLNNFPDRASNSALDIENDTLNIQGQERVNGENLDSDYICPICSKNFTGKFTIFHKHVSDHFEDGNEEFTSATFEIVP